MKDFMARVLKGPIVSWNRLYTNHYYKSKKQNLQAEIDTEIPQNKKICVISPHVDDETMGLGGAMIQMIERGCRIDIIYVTDSCAFSGNIPPQKMKAVREEEATVLKEKLGIRYLYGLELKDGKEAEDTREAIRKLESILKESEYDIVYLPFMIDGHPKHRMSTRISLEAMEHIAYNKDLLFYETNIPIDESLVNVIYPMDEKAFEGKEALYQCFSSQTTAYDFDVFQLLQRARHHYVPDAYAVEVFVRMKRQEAQEFMRYQNKIKFNPMKYPRVGNHRSLYKQYLKMPKDVEQMVDWFKKFLEENRVSG